MVIQRSRQPADQPARFHALVDQSNVEHLGHMKELLKAYPRPKNAPPIKSYLVGDRVGTKVREWLDLAPDKSYLILDGV